MSQSPEPPGASSPGSFNVKFAALAGAVVLVVLAGGLLIPVLLARRPPPVEVASDPQLVQGQEVYNFRCAGCHGATGRGDGPLARGLPGSPPGDLTRPEKRKRGTAVAEVLAVIREGVPGTNMSGFAKYHILDDAEIRAVTAYVYHLGGQAVPDELRNP